MSDDTIELPESEGLAGEERRYTVEQAATMTAVSVTLVRRLAVLNVIETEQEQLHGREIARLAQILRLRRDLGVNWIGAGMVLDLTQEIARLKALLQAYEAHTNAKD